MLFPILGLALGSATLISAQSGGGNTSSAVPTTIKTPIGGQCAALGPSYYSACCATAVNDPSCSKCGPWGCGMTTSVVYTTVCVTVSDCPATVTNCPYRTKPVTTDTITSYTTICPVSVSTTEAPVSKKAKVTTVFTNTVVTVTSCPPEVTNCPARTVTSKTPVSTICDECPEEVNPPLHTQVIVVGSTVPPAKSSNAPSQTSSIIQFTGAAEVKQVGTWGLVAGFLFALL